MQRLIERQCLVERTAIIRHAAAVKLHARIAAKRLAADLTRALSARKVRSRAVAEIESRTNVAAGVGIAVIPFVPPGAESNGWGSPVIVPVSSQICPGSSALFITLRITK